MSLYAPYLPELRTATLFCDMSDEEILRVLDTLQPPIKQGRPELGQEGKPPREEAFRMVLRSRPARDLAPRHFKYDMPKFGEPGMLMAEIPVLSRMKDYIQDKGGPAGPFGKKPDMELETLEFTPDMLTRFYTPEASPAQGKMLRNLLGILSQKVCDIRQELFLLRDGRDMYHGLTLPPEDLLHVLSAGVAMNSVKKAVRVWNALHPELPAACVSGGSVDLIRAVQEGEPCDVLISAELPPEMDLSELALAKTYAQVSFAIDAEQRVQGAPIAHALTIPKGSRHREAAKAFARLFQETDFAEAGLLERSGISGEDPLA